MPAESFYCLDNFFKKMTDLDSPKKNNDCYFYYYSTCAKGDSCTFRHEASALGCETMCSFWKEGKCVNVHCNFRHMELRKNRKAIPCYWESQPVGCLKAHCPFLHQNPRPAEAVNRSNLSTDQSVGDMNSSSERKVTAVDSLVVNFEEESDTESTPTFSPKKSGDRIVTVKSLEEIRLEKIQAESAAYYSYQNQFPTYDENDEATVLRQRIFSRMLNKGLPERIVTIPQKRVSDSMFTSTFEKKRKIVYHNEDGNLKIRLNKGMNRFASDVDIRYHSEMDVDEQVSVTYSQKPRQRRIPPAKPSSTTNQINVADIKIKTLEEIRRERRAKDDTPNEDEQEVTSTSMDIDVRTPETSKPAQRDRKIVLRRKSPASTTVEDISFSDTSVSNNANRSSETVVQKDQYETASTSSKFDEEVFLLEDDDFDDDTVLLKPEDELLNEIDDCLDD